MTKVKLRAKPENETKAESKSISNNFQGVVERVTEWMNLI